MATRPNFRCLVAALLGVACQPAAIGPPTAESLPVLYDDAAFAAGFSPSASPDEMGPTDPLEAATEGGVTDSLGTSNADAGFSSDEGLPDADVIGDAQAQPEGACSSPLSPGSLLVDEIMIESVAGAGDDGEWLEAQSTLGCAINLIGLHGECARGANLITFDVTGDFWLPPGGFFVVSDSAVPAINHYLPGQLVTWAGHPGDVLRNKGSTVTLRMNDVLIDTITYPALKLQVGKSWAFPSDCDPSQRDDFGKWQVSASSWFPLFYGTPNAPNDDVHCL